MFTFDFVKGRTTVMQLLHMLDEWTDIGVNFGGARVPPIIKLGGIGGNAPNNFRLVTVFSLTLAALFPFL